MKVFISEARYVHPDVTVTRDPRDRGRIQALQSPRLVIEVLSPNTELTDRTWKRQLYRAHPTIEAYVFADARSPKVEIYHKKGDIWIYDAFENDDEAPFSSLGVRLSLADISTDAVFENTEKEG